MRGIACEMRQSEARQGRAVTHGNKTGGCS